MPYGAGFDYIPHDFYDSTRSMKAEENVALNWERARAFDARFLFGTIQKDVNLKNT